MASVSEVLTSLREWLSGHAALGTWLLALSLLLTLGGLVLVRWFVLALPADYFTRSAPDPASWRAQHPALRWGLKIGKNLVGLLLLLVGLTMLVAPGPGVVTLLLALVLLDLPGKRALEHKLIALPTVLHTINKIRARSKLPAVEMPTRL